MDNLDKLMKMLASSFGDDPSLDPIREKAESLMKENQQRDRLNSMFYKATKSRPVFRHKDTAYTIDNGCKIERYSDGSVKIYNTRTGGDFYEHVSPYYYSIFEEHGFEIGSMQLSVDTLEIALNKIKDRTEKKFEIEKTNLKQKIDDYKNQIFILKKRNSRSHTNEA